MAWEHGPLLLESFWADQVGGKTGFRGSPWRVSLYFLICVPFLLPWLLCLGYLHYKGEPEKPLTAIQRKTTVFALIWAGLLPIIFGLGDRIQVRYLVPAIPLLAVVMAIGMCRFSNARIATVADLLLNVVTLGFLAIAIFGLSVLWQNGLLSKHFAGFCVLFLILLLVALRWQRRQFSSQAVLSISLFLVLPLILAILSPFTLPDQTTQVTRALQRLNPEKKPVFVIGTNKLASRLRISSGGEYVIHQAKRADLLKIHPGPGEPIFVLSQGEAQHVPANSVQLREIAAYPIRVSLSKVFLATLKGQAKAYIESCKIHCYAVLADSMSMSAR